MCLALWGSGIVTSEQPRRLAVGALAHGDAMRLHLCARTYALQAIYHDGLAGRKSRLHHSQPADYGAQLPRPVLDLVAGPDDQHVPHGLVRADGAIVDQHRIVLSTVQKPDSGKEARREKALVVLEERTAVDRAGGGIQGIVDEYQGALVRIAALVGAAYDHRVARRVLRGAASARPRELAVPQIRLLIAIEGHVDRIERYQRRQRRYPTRNVVSAGDQRAADASCYWGGDARELEIERCGIKCRLRTLDTGLRLLVAGGAGVELLLGDGMLAKELGAAVALGLRERQLRARLRELRARLVALGDVRPWVDDEEHVPLMHLIAVAEVDAGDVAGNPRPDLDALHRLEAPGEFVELRHLARDSRGDRHLRRRRRLLLRSHVACTAAREER